MTSFDVAWPELKAAADKARERVERLDDEIDSLLAVKHRSKGQEDRLRRQRSARMDASAEFERLRSQMGDALTAEIANPGSSLDVTPVGQGYTIGTGTDERAWSFSGPMHRLGTNELRSRAFSAIEAWPVTDMAKERATGILEHTEDSTGNASRYFLASSAPAYRSAFTKWLKGREDEWTDQERHAVGEARSYLATGASAGELVPAPFDPQITVVGGGVRSGIASVAREVFIASGSSYKFPTAGQVSGAWTTTENTELADASPTIGETDISLFTGSAFAAYSIELELDSADLVASEVTRVLVDAVSILEETAFATGDGTNAPKGLATAVSADTSQVISSTTTDTYGLVDAYAVHDALDPRHFERATWFMHPKVATLTRQFGTSADATHWVDLAGGEPPRFLGKPVIYSSALDGTINAGSDNYLLFFGDPQKYAIVRRLGMTAERIRHMHGSNQRPTMTRGLLVYSRLGADTIDSSAFVSLNVT
jgi:HK97 family phage major capsid protein